MRIILEKSKCIGCGTCEALCPKYFKLGEDGKSHLKGAKFTEPEENETLEIKNVGCAKDAADSCPVQCINIK